MPERAKVIKGLEALRHAMSEHQCYVCSHEFIDAADEFGTNIVDNALALLKEQEPKQIIRKQGKQENSDGSIDYFGEWYCPHCGKLLNRGFDLPWIEFCYKCGGAVKWE